MDFVNDTTSTTPSGKAAEVLAGRLVNEALDDIHVKGQGGLLDATHWRDNDADEEWYLTYSKTDRLMSTNRRQRWFVHRGRQGLNAWRREKLFVATRRKDHDTTAAASRSAVVGKLYLTRRTRPPGRIRRPCDLSGKVHRFNPDGSIPEDNPFVNQPDAVLPIWSWGHRNPQGMFCHPETGTIWTHEHGPVWR